jgi:uncharacterized protein
LWKGPSYDCQQCGACCANQESIPASGYVSLSGAEPRLMKRLGLSVFQTDGRSFLGTRYRGESNHAVCVALEGHVGGSCACAIYEHRPSNCRRFEVGSRLCRAARADAGLPI